MSPLRRPPPPTSFEQATAQLDAVWQAVDQLAAFVAQLADRDAEIERLTRRNEELENELREAVEQMGKSSRNSSKPPSSDSPAQRKNRRKKPRSARRKGAQPGHDKHERALHPELGATATPCYLPPSTCGCGGAVAIESEPFVRHQVFDIPVVRFSFVEHRLYRGRCTACAKVHCATTPDSVPSGQMGPNLVALITHLAGEFHLSIRDIQRFLREHYSLEFSTGAIAQAPGLALPALAVPYGEIGDFVRRQPVAHADETRHFRNSSTYWLWTLATVSAVYFLVHPSRGMAAADALFKDFGGTAVTDDYSGYNRLEVARRQLCWCHLLRHLIAISERTGNAGRIGDRLVLLTRAVFRNRHRYEHEDITEPIYQRRMARLRRSITESLERGGRLRLDGRTRRQCRHLLVREPMFWTFLGDDRVPLENNLAERMIRPYVIWRRTSYWSQSHQGDRFRPMVLSVLMTAKLLGVSGYELLRRTCTEWFEQGEVLTRLPLPQRALPSPG